MNKGRIFFVVGHRRWGKSTTLRALTGRRLARSFLINSHKFYIRRTSNDDVRIGEPPTGYYEFLSHLKPEQNLHVLATLCPTLWDKRLFNNLRRLKASYQLFFFVLKRRWDGKRQISVEEISALRKLGIGRRTYEFKKEGEATQRANSLKLFIQKNT